MDFAEFAAAAADIESESADTAIRDRVVDLLGRAGNELPTVVRFLLGRVFPAHESRTLDIGPRLCYEAIARAAGPNVSADDVEARLADLGETGDVAASYDFGQQGLDAFGDGDGRGLTVGEVEDRLRDVAAAEGEGSQETKLDVLFGLLARMDPQEARYLARLVLSEMRIGVGEGTVRDAIAVAFDIPLADVERALQVSNDYGLVAERARDGGRGALADSRLEIGRPVQAMLAQTGTVSDALEDWGEVAVEWKYDGARVQVHYDGESVELYSRNMEDVTDPLPEIVATVEERVDVPAILDGEVVAVDEDGTPRPFQQVLRRFRRKYDVAQAREDVGLRVHVFDCLHADGEDLLDAPLVERHERLREIVGDGDAVSHLRQCSDADRVEAIEEEALAAGHEGVMLKNPSSAYTPGKRGKNWLKRKPDVETLDLVVTGAEWGEGRRASLFGTFELSVRTDDGCATVGNVATGITDEKLEALTALLEPHVRAEDGTDVDVDPAVVFEVGYEEIQSSPSPTGGINCLAPVSLTMPIRHDGLGVEWLGYATIRVEGEDAVVYVDPGRYGVLTGGWTPPSDDARRAHPPARDYRPEDGDIVFVTHRHHYDPDGIERVAGDDATIVAFEGIEVHETPRTDVRPADLPYEVREVGMEAEGDVAGVQFWSVPAYNHPGGPHTRQDGSPVHPEGFGCGYLIVVDGVRVFYPGDTDVLNGHAALDVSLFFPSIDDTFSMGGESAVELAAEMDPDLVLPVHYNTFDRLEADARAFAADVAARGVPVVLDEN